MEKKKQIVIIVFIVFAVILLLCLCKIHMSNNLKRNDGSTQNQVGQNQSEFNNVIIEDGITKLNLLKNVAGLEFSNVEIEMISEYECEFRAEVFNTNDKIMEAKTIKIVATGNEGLNEVFGAQMASVLPNETISVSTVIRKDITSTTNVEFEIID